MAVLRRIIKDLETRLDSFDRKARKESLKSLIELVDCGDITFDPEQDVANLHCHSFFSFNGYGYSPTHLAWKGKKSGLKFMGIVDFDVLDGVDEFLDACESVGLRGSAGIETRVYIPQFADREINSPGEPGVYYNMGIGFSSSFAPPSARTQLEDIRRRVAQRNCQMLEKINAYLDPLYVDYERDILPMTPSGNATERHMVAKIILMSHEKLNDPSQFWSEKLGLPANEIRDLAEDPEVFQNTVRKKLMKRGGVGYTLPTADTFPLVDEFHQVVRNSQAIPCAAWLDGTSPGEQAIEELLSILIEKGTAAINIIPDRNWNIANPQEKKIKLDHLYRITELAVDLDLPVNVGTEMNSFGQKLSDDFSAPELAPIRDVFLDGAWFIYGHTWMQRRWGLGYQSHWAERNFFDRRSRNEFFITAGKLLPPKISNPVILKRINLNQKPDEVIGNLKLIKDNELNEK